MVRCSRATLVLPWLRAWPRCMIRQRSRRAALLLAVLDLTTHWTFLPLTLQVTLTLPAGPCGPVAPAGPCGPAAPAGPCGPAAPAGPCGPVAPLLPLLPSVPSVPSLRKIAVTSRSASILALQVLGSPATCLQPIQPAIT